MLQELPENPTPQDFGFPQNPTTTQARCWARQERFLAALAESGSVGAAAAASDVPVFTTYSWDSADTHSFKRRKQIALESYMGKVEAEINRRGVEGWDEPLHHKGELTGDVVRRYSDNLLMFRAKRLDPAYKDNYQPQQANSTINITQTIIEVRDYRNNASLQPDTAPRIVEAGVPDSVTDTDDESLSVDELT